MKTTYIKLNCVYKLVGKLKDCYLAKKKKYFIAFFIIGI